MLSKTDLEHIPHLPKTDLEHIPQLPKTDLEHIPHLPIKHIPHLPKTDLEHIPHLPKTDLEHIPHLPKSDLQHIPHLPKTDLEHIPRRLHIIPFSHTSTPSPQQLQHNNINCFLLSCYNILVHRQIFLTILYLLLFTLSISLYFLCHTVKIDRHTFISRLLSIKCYEVS